MKVLFAEILLAAAVVSLLACSTDPVKARIEFMRSGDAYYEDGKYRHALVQFKNAVEMDPRSAEAHYRLGCTQLKLQNAPDAYRAFLEAVTLDPANVDARMELASLLIEKGDPEEAQVVVRKVLESDPKNVRAHEIMGASFISLQDFPSGIAAYERAVELDPSRVATFGALGATHLAAGPASQGRSRIQEGCRSESGLGSSQDRTGAVLLLSAEVRRIGKRTEGCVQAGSGCSASP